jgi:hypothetical protein
MVACPTCSHGAVMVTVVLVLMRSSSMGGPVGTIHTNVSLGSLVRLSLWR